MTTEIEIKVRNRARVLRLKKHFEETHPSLRGNVKIEGGCPFTSTSKFKFNPMAQAIRVTQL